MRPWLGVGMLVAGGAVGVVSLAHLRWGRETAQAVARLEPSGALPASTLEGLPAPVARYFAYALSPAQPRLLRARLEQQGELLMGPGNWRPFSATQHFSGGTPGFVWDATLRMNPLLGVRVRDSYLRGEGTMLGKVEALVPVVHQHGTREMAEASLQRWLAEAVWLPTALLPREGLTWSAVDARTARASVTDHGVSVWVDFEFADSGEIIGTSTLRYRDVNGRPVLTPWKGRFWGYEQVGGVRIPREGEVGWVLPEGLQPYWRGRMVEARFEN